jgi:DNA-binding IclR family transcriptional regulator
MPSESDILDCLRSQPGLKRREIASRQNADKAEVNSMLWKLKNRWLTRQNNAYRWFIVERATTAATQAQQAPKQLITLMQLYV